MRWMKRVSSLHYLIAGIWICSMVLTFKLYINLTSATESNSRRVGRAEKLADHLDHDGNALDKDRVRKSKRNQFDVHSDADVTSLATKIGEFVFDVQEGDPTRDWHDYKLIESEKKRRGPGEQGVPVDPNQLGNKPEQDQLFSANGFNAYVSDAISLERMIRDIRHPDCSSSTYSARLPTVSVIIPFYEEHLSTLLRTVYSVVNRSPRHLLAEVILSDDGSSKSFLGRELEQHIEEHFARDEAEAKRTNRVPVIVVRAKKRSGLIRARLAGAKIARGDVLLFLDSHCEANVNWLPPLIDPIARDYRTVTCPFIDVIDYDTFEYRAQDEGARGAFDWQFFYKRLPLTAESLRNPSKPFDSPVMAGGLFAISKRWFDELGGYDPHLLIWGGEQYELSFKIWQCGGRMVDTPCSRVGHIYRKYSPFPTSSEFGDFTSRNYKRVAEVWMDDWKQHLYKRMANVRMADPGDLTEQIAVRERLKCKSFDWFMKNVAFDLTRHYPAVEPEPSARGHIRLKGNDNVCIDAQHGDTMQRIGLSRCGRGEQDFQITYHRDIRLTGGRDHFCLDAPEHYSGGSIVLFSCHNQGGNQLFKYNLKTGQLFHPSSNLCIDADVQQMLVRLMSCDKDSSTQHWELAQMNQAALEELWNSIV